MGDGNSQGGNAQDSLGAWDQVVNYGPPRNQLFGQRRDKGAQSAQPPKLLGKGPLPAVP